MRTTAASLRGCPFCFQVRSNSSVSLEKPDDWGATSGDIWRSLASGRRCLSHSRNLRPSASRSRCHIVGMGASVLVQGPAWRRALAIRSSASVRIAREVAKLMRTKPCPGRPKAGPGESATFACSRK